MLYEALYFAHLSGLALWMGSMIAVLWMGYRALRTPQVEQQIWGLQTAGGLSSWVTTPSAAIVVAAGVAMMVVGGMLGTTKPLWFSIMEQGGGMLAMIGVAVTTMFGRRMRRIAQDSHESLRLGRSVRLYMGTLSGLTLGVAGVLLAVSLRL